MYMNFDAYFVRSHSVKWVLLLLLLLFYFVQFKTDFATGRHECIVHLIFQQGMYALRTLAMGQYEEYGDSRFCCHSILWFGQLKCIISTVSEYG